MMNRLRETLSRRRGVVGFVAGLTVAGVVGGAGAAIATIPASTTGTYTGCVAKTTGAVRVVDAQKGKKCTRKETTITWGKGYRYRSRWVTTTAYAPLDVVVHNGSSYVAKTASKGKAPSSTLAAWGLLAAAGATGAAGAPGPKGDPGAKGTARAYALISIIGAVSRSTGGITVSHTALGNYCVTVAGVDPLTSVAVVAPDYQGDSSNLGAGAGSARVEYSSGNCSANAGFQVVTADVRSGTATAFDQSFVFMVP